MYHEINLVSNGKIEDYPVIIPIKILKVKHWEQLVEASEGSDEVLDSVLTSVLNDLVDWSKVKGINSVDDLTISDRLKLFFFERVNSKGTAYGIQYKCSNCGEISETTLDIKDIKENKLKNKISLTEKSSSGLTLRIPKRRDKSKLNSMINNLRSEVFSKISDLKADELLIEGKINKINSDIKFLELTQDTNIDHSEKINDKKEEIKKIENDLKNIKSESYDNNIKDKTISLLKNNNLEYKDIDLSEIKKSEDLYFSKFCADMITYYIFIDTDMELNEYFEYIKELDATILGEIDRWVEKIYHGFDNKVSVKCKCGYVNRNTISISPRFFFQ